MNARALRLRGFDDEITDYSDLGSFLETIATESVLAEHWINNLVRPVLMMLLYIRAEREGEFALQLYVCKKMIPYFFAAGHWYYSRDSICYIQSMEKLPKAMLDQLMKGEHVLRHQKGYGTEYGLI